ncbi:GAF and ANTAR domain-containing protein [Nocardia jiangsuensis]|uniref:GAF and ANTAR domain-containing protein n=1 Tax=Nocardia jiangsuensis TaxID=1691563 RepID=A0ABV8DNK0_9NOCA
MTGSDRANSAGDDLRAALLRAMGESGGGLAAVTRLARLALESLPIDGASVSLMADTGNRETLYTSDDVIAEIENRQFGLGEGPCFEAFETRRPVLIADLDSPDGARWPIFAAERGERIAAVYAFPLVTGATCLGVVALYRARPGWLSTADLAVTLRIIDAVTVALLEMGAEHRTAPWTDLPANHPHIHQATGMLIAAFQMPAQHALARLRGYAFSTGRPLAEVADDLVTRRLDPHDLDQC